MALRMGAVAISATAAVAREEYVDHVVVTYAKGSCVGLLEDDLYLIPWFCKRQEIIKWRSLEEVSGKQARWRVLRYSCFV